MYSNEHILTSLSFIDTLNVNHHRSQSFEISVNMALEMAVISHVLHSATSSWGLATYMNTNICVHNIVTI